MNVISPEIAEQMFNRGLGAAAVLLIAMAVMAGFGYAQADQGEIRLASFCNGIAAVLAVGAIVCVVLGIYAGFLTAVPA
jgi:hypothetical protein